MIISLLVEFMAMGVLVACITGLNYTLSLILGAIAILIYTGAGGYLSVAYTDFVQSILMIIGLFILIPVCISNVGGLSGMNQGLIQINDGLATLWGEDYYLKGAPLMIAGIALVYFIGYMGQPHLIIKTVAIKDEKSIKLVPMIGAAFGFVLSFGVYILGMVGRVAYPDISMLPGGSAEYIMPMLALSNLPPVLAGLILAGATAAIMSTASALLLVIGSSVGNDLLTMAIPQASEESKMKITRWSTYFLGLVACAMCYVFHTAVFGRRLPADMDSMVSTFTGIHTMYHRRPLLEERHQRWRHSCNGRWLHHRIRMVLSAAGQDEHTYLLCSSGAGDSCVYSSQQTDQETSPGCHRPLLLCKELRRSVRKSWCSCCS